MPTANLNQKFLSDHGQASIDFTAPDTQPDVALAFANNTALPFRQINLGSISAKASVGTGNIKFGDGANQVSFDASASGFAGLGAYPDPARLLADLKLEGDLSSGIELPKDPNSLYLALTWGYNLAASAKGAIALGAPLTFSASGKREALYAVVRRLPKETKALAAVGTTAKSWMMPKQVDDLDDLEPGTWLIAEVDGSFGASLGIKYGYDFNWVHEAKLMGLSGEIGLSLKLGVEAALGFNMASSFGLVVGRESMNADDKFLRVRLFRLKRKGWTFAFDAGASVKGDVSKFLPEYDQFIKAIFGVHGGQVLEDLKLVETWTDPETSLGQLLSEKAVSFGEDFLEKLTGVDPEVAFNTAVGRVSEVIQRWNDLPHKVSTTIYRFIEKKIDLTDVRDLVGKIAGANQDTFNTLIKQLAGNIDFLHSPAGEWLEQAAARELTELLNSSHEFEQLQKIAIKTKALLDGSELESVLEKLQTYIEEHLNLNQLFPGFAKLEDIIGAGSIQDLDQASFAKLETWLKAKLAGFLDKKIADLKLEDINKIRQAIFGLLQKSRQFYEKTIKALNSTYEFNISYRHQSTTTNTALLDIVLDFSKQGVANTLQHVLNGEYDEVLMKKQEGLKINLGTLTHEIKRNTHVELNLPWRQKSIDHINASLAKFEVVDDDGRLYVLDATDIVKEKNERLSKLTVGGYLEVDLNQTRVHNKEEITYAYTLRQVKKEMKLSAVQYQVQPYVNEYLLEAFPQGLDGVGEWITDRATLIDRLENNGEKIFGNTLLGLNLSLPAEVGAAWLNAQPEAKGNEPKVAAYLAMSRRIQRKLKEIIPFYYFGDLDNFEESELPSKTLLVYAAIPPRNHVRVQGNQMIFDTDDYYWDSISQPMRANMAGLKDTTTKLKELLDGVNKLLSNAGMTDTANRFKPSLAEAIQKEVINADEPEKGNFRSLLLTESQIINGALQSGYAMARFCDLKNSKPTEAVKALAEFGSKVTETFNANITSIYGGGAIRPLGTALFIEVASILDPNAASAADKTIAMLDVTVLKRDAKFVMATYLDGQVPEQTDILVHERIIR